MPNIVKLPRQTQVEFLMN